MKITSDAYKQEIAEPFRNRWYVTLYVGFIKEKFQFTAQLEPISELSFLSTGANDHLFDNNEIDERVATFEQDLFKADGSSTFMNEAHNNVGLPFYGLISEDISDAEGNMSFQLGVTSSTGEKGLGGLTLEFMEDAYPTNLTIKALVDGEESFSRDYDNDSMIFTTTDDFGDEVDKLIIQVNKLNKPYCRFRLRYILLGVGIVFNNEDFLTSTGSYKQYMHSRSVELPTQDLTLKLDNYDNRFNFDRDGSLINLMEAGQDVSLQILYEMEDGTMEYIPEETVEISSFSADRSSLTLKAVDFLRNENAEITFEDSSFFTEETTLYDVAEEVVKYVENTTFRVEFDEALKSVPVKFRECKTTVKEALMMIASAGRCVMEFIPKGLRLRRKDIKHANMSSGSETGTPYSDNTFAVSGPITTYADFQQDLVKANGTSLFPPTSPLARTGYVSAEVSKEDGTFDGEVSFYITSDEGISPSYFICTFVGVTPVKYTITTYFDDKEVETLSFSDGDSSTIAYYHDFEVLNKVKITVTKILEPYRRVVVSYMGFDEYVYTIDENILENERPQAELTDVVRNIFVNYGYSAAEEDGYLTIPDSVQINCNSKGTDIEYDNYFITSEEVAREVGEWLKEYYQVQMVYSFSWMGDPSIEVNDTIRVPNEYNSNLICNIETNDVDFSNGGIRGKIEARRNVNGMDTTKNRLVIE